MVNSIIHIRIYPWWKPSLHPTFLRCVGCVACPTFLFSRKLARSFSPRDFFLRWTAVSSYHVSSWSTWRRSLRSACKESVKAAVTLQQINGWEGASNESARLLSNARTRKRWGNNWFTACRLTSWHLKRWVFLSRSNLWWLLFILEHLFCTATHYRNPLWPNGPQVGFYFSLRHLGHLSPNSIKTRRNSIHWPMFSDIMTELTNFFSVIWKKN